MEKAIYGTFWQGTISYYINVRTAVLRPKISKKTKEKLEGLKNEKNYKKMPIDILLTVCLMMPMLYPDFVLSKGLMYFAKTVVGFVIIIACICCLALTCADFKTKEKLFGTDLYKVDIWYKLYEPISDLAIAIGLISSGSPVMAGCYFFSGLYIRSTKYYVIEGIKENASEGN